MSVYHGQFSDKDGVLSSFEVDDAKRSLLEGAEFLFAAYGGIGYEGFAIVVYELGGTLYEVNGSHCSCYGLEGQWKPEATTWEAIAMRSLDSDEYDTSTIEAWARLVQSRNEELLAKREGES